MKIGNPQDINGNPLLINVAVDGNYITGSGTTLSPLNFAGIPALNDQGTVVISGAKKIKAGTGISFTSNADQVIINASTDISSESLLSYATSLDFNIDNNTYVISAVLKNGNTVLTSKTIDLPLETMVISASYNNSNKNIVLNLKNGNTVTCPIGDIVDGLVPSTRKVNNKSLNADVEIYGTDIKINNANNAVTVSAAIMGRGDMFAADYVNAGGNGVVLSASNATSAAYAANAGAVNWDNINNKPDSFAGEDHNHQVADITDFNQGVSSVVLDMKASSNAYGMVQIGSGIDVNNGIISVNINSDNLTGVVKHFNEVPVAASSSDELFIYDGTTNLDYIKGHIYKKETQTESVANIALVDEEDSEYFPAEATGQYVSIGQDTYTNVEYYSYDEENDEYVTSTLPSLTIPRFQKTVNTDVYTLEFAFLESNQAEQPGDGEWRIKKNNTDIIASLHVAPGMYSGLFTTFSLTDFNELQDEWSSRYYNEEIGEYDSISVYLSINVSETSNYIWEDITPSSGGNSSITSGGSIQVDDVITSNGINPVAGGAIYNALQNLNNGITGSASYATSAGNVNWSNIQNKPNSFAPQAHSHQVANITDFNTNVSSIVSNMKASSDVYGVVKVGEGITVSQGIISVNISNGNAIVNAVAHFDTMPSPESSADEVVVYTGETGSSYAQGHIYKKISVGGGLTITAQDEPRDIEGDYQILDEKTVNGFQVPRYKHKTKDYIIECFYDSEDGGMYWWVIKSESIVQYQSGFLYAADNDIENIDDIISVMLDPEQIWNNNGTDAYITVVRSSAQLSWSDITPSTGSGSSSVISGSIQVDSAITSDGVNPVTGSAIYNALNAITSSVYSDFNRIFISNNTTINADDFAVVDTDCTITLPACASGIKVAISTIDDADNVLVAPASGDVIIQGETNNSQGIRIDKVYGYVELFGTNNGWKITRVS